MKLFVSTFAAVLFGCAVGALAPEIASAQASNAPAPPQTYLTTTYAPPTGGTVRTVNAGGNLQAALDAANPGDTIVLQAGATFTGNFVLPYKTGSSYIYIRTSAPDSNIPAPGVRQNPSFAAAMPKIVTPNAAAALKTAIGAHHYRLIGIEFAVAAAVPTNYGVVVFGDVGNAQNSLGQVPHDLVIDRCYIHGNTTGTMTRGVALNAASASVIDSYISESHDVSVDTQAIMGWNGPGPFKIVNNYLEASGENVMFGGGDPSIPNLVPSDIEFRRNLLSKPVSWNPSDPTFVGAGGNPGQHWMVKNLMELKNARRILLDGNRFEYCWADAQVGFAIVLTPRNQDGGAPWAAVQDVTMTNNYIRHANAGINLLGWDDINTSQQMMRVLIKNNLFDDIGSTWAGGSGRLFQILNNTVDLNIDHNTSVQTTFVVFADSQPNTRFTYTNNIAPHNQFGVFGSNFGSGTPALNHYFPPYSFQKNVLPGGASSAYPANNYFPATMNNVGFVDFAGHDYRLSPSSPYHNAGTDGTDLGANIAALDAAQPPAFPAVAAGTDTVGIYVPATAVSFLRNSNTPGAADSVFAFGPSGAGVVPLTGDWNGDGIDTPGIYIPATGTFFLKSTQAGGTADIVFTFGPANGGFVPVVGDWDGDGIDTVGIYRPTDGFFFLTNVNAPGPAPLVFGFGPGGFGFKPVAGDWDGDGIDTVGVYDPATGNFFLRNRNAPGAADIVFSFGPGGLGWLPVSGDFDGNRTDTVGAYSPTTGVFFLRNSNTSGAADVTVGYGPPAATPLIGDWDGR